MVLVRTSKLSHANKASTRIRLFDFKVNFVRQLIMLGIHLFFLTTAIFLRNPKDDQPLVKKIFCHIAEVCVLVGCIISLFTLLAKEIYLQGLNYYVQNLVGEHSQCVVLDNRLVLSFRLRRKVTQRNCSINVRAFCFSWHCPSVCFTC